MRATRIYRGALPDLILPDHLANWDVFDYWERRRTGSMLAELTHDDCLWVIGAEHGAMAAMWSRFAGSVVLVEPSPPFWRNIRLTWEANDLRPPAACVAAFLADKATDDVGPGVGWPSSAWESNEECPAQEYRYLFNEQHAAEIPTTTVDTLVAAGAPAPTAISVDTEGAEVLILKGAETTLTGDVLAWVSVHPDLIERDYAPRTDQDVHDLMAGLGYTARLLAADHEEHWFYRR